MDIEEQHKLYVMLLKQHSNLNVATIISKIQSPEYKDINHTDAYSKIMYTLSNTHDNFESFLKDIKNTRQFSHTIVKIKNFHKNSLRNMNYFNYILFLNANLNKLKTVLIDEKNKTEKEIIAIFESILSPIDMRLIMFPNYHKFSLDIGDRENLLSSLCHINSDLETEKLNWNDFNYIKTYALCCFDLFDIFETIIKNDKDDTIIFLVDTKASSHTFYIKNTSNYSLENRLYNFTRSFINQVSEYIIYMFRTNYFNIFHDYSYRKNYIKESSVLDVDNRFLIKNLMYLSKFSLLREKFCNIIQKHKSRNESELTFNSKSDDFLIQKKISKIEQDFDKSIASHYIKRLFDDITDAQCLELNE
jgi:hypothetical protein